MSIHFQTRACFSAINVLAQGRPKHVLHPSSLSSSTCRYRLHWSRSHHMVLQIHTAAHSRIHLPAFFAKYLRALRRWGVVALPPQSISTYPVLAKISGLRLSKFVTKFGFFKKLTNFRKFRWQQRSKINTSFERVGEHWRRMRQVRSHFRENRQLGRSQRIWYRKAAVFGVFWKRNTIVVQR